jgi:hypothetical protein
MLATDVTDIIRCLANDEGAVRLVGGSTGYEGRVEIYHK